MCELPAGLRFEAAAVPDPVQRLAAWAATLGGWHRAGTAFLLGCLAAATLPPVDLAPLLFPSFAGLLWLGEGCRRPRDWFALGWSFGFGFFLAGLYWIAISLFTDIAAFWWMLPFTIVALPALLALFVALALLAQGWLAPRGSARAAALAVLWTAAEWLRGHLFTGFPWNLIGYAWAGGFPGASAVLQATSVTGIYGLSLVTVLAAALPASLGEPGPAGSPPWRRRLPAVAGLAVLVALGAAGALRLAGDAGAVQPGVRLRLVQPSIAQTLKWDPAERASNFRRLLALSALPGAARATDIIWPEAAVPFFLDRNPAALAAISAVVPPGGLILTGALRSDPPAAPAEHVWNSLLAIDGAGRIIGGYDKVHLVPFGEYVPFRSILPVRKITAGMIDLSAGSGPTLLRLRGLPPVAPSICYEDIFPDEIVPAGSRPGWLLNITNDAWFGFSSGPFQHFAMARVRSVEQGLPLVSAANNGISAVVDAYGRIVRRLGLDDIGVVDAALPAPLPQPTIFARLGEWPLLVLLLACAAAPLYSRYRQPR